MPSIESNEDLEIRLLLEAIYLRYGYDFRDYALDSMRRRVRVALAKSGACHLGELQHRVLHEPELFALLVDTLTVQVSDMFRDPRFYRTLREQVLPILRTYPQIKIWHAGCASGEEVYTTAILLAEEGLYERSQIYATDMSPHAVEQAREGVYAGVEVPRFKHNYELSGGTEAFETYYIEAYGRIAVREGLRKNVVFFQHDLVSDYVLGEMQLIFCRNVLIYFGPELRQKVISTLSRGLCRGGFLCLGSSEHLPPSQAHQFSEFSGSDRVYRFRGVS